MLARRQTSVNNTYKSSRNMYAGCANFLEHRITHTRVILTCVRRCWPDHAFPRALESHGRRNVRRYIRQRSIQRGFIIVSDSFRRFRRNHPVRLEYTIFSLSRRSKQKKTHDKLFLVQLRDRPPRTNLLIHERLRERWLVELVVPPSTIDDEVNNDVFTEVVAVLEGDVNSANDICVCIQMEVVSNDEVEMNLQGSLR
jgi:hypothetical protein